MRLSPQLRRNFVELHTVDGHKRIGQLPCDFHVSFCSLVSTIAVTSGEASGHHLEGRRRPL